MEWEKPVSLELAQEHCPVAGRLEALLPAFLLQLVHGAARPPGGAGGAGECRWVQGSAGDSLRGVQGSAEEGTAPSTHLVSSGAFLGAAATIPGGGGGVPIWGRGAVRCREVHGQVQ